MYGLPWTRLHLPVRFSLQLYTEFSNACRVDSDEVTEWMKELDGVDIPDLEPTTDGSCASDPEFSSDAANRGWWTCGHHTRDTDITVCPDKLTWGVRYAPCRQSLICHPDQFPSTQLR